MNATSLPSREFLGAVHQPLPPPPESKAGHRAVPFAVVGGICVSIALLILNALCLAWNANSTLRSSDAYARSYEVKRALSAFQAVTVSAEASQRGYLLTGRTEYLAPFFDARERWRQELAQLRALIQQDKRSSRHLATLDALMSDALRTLERTIAANDSPGPDGAVDVRGTESAKATMDRLRQIVDRMLVEEDARIASLRREVFRDMVVTVGVAFITTLVASVVVLGLYRLLRRYLAARERAEQALRQANVQLNHMVAERTAKLAELSQHLLRVAEEEKAKVARDLHDTLGSNLTAINMDLNWVCKRLPESQPELRERMQRALQMLTTTVELKRNLIEGLRPSHLDSLGLGFAMRSLCDEYSKRTGVQCELDVSEDFEDLDPTLSIAMYRIAQEALTNTAKHAQARHARVQLRREAQGMRLRIDDDGRGITPEAMSKPKSHGLMGMRERVHQLGGWLDIRPGSDGHGTVIEAFVPNMEPEAAAAYGGQRI
jgi:signal transduction histidine kinase